MTSALFCVALALYRDPEGPGAINDAALQDPDIRRASRSIVELREHPESGKSFDARITVHLKDGRQLVREADTFKGRPNNPLTRDELRRKFLLSWSADESAGTGLFDRLEHLEVQPRFTVA